MKKKIIISKLWLYRYRFILGYILLGCGFVAIITSLPFFTPNGLSETEMVSAVNSYNTHFSSIADGNVVDLPYRILQKISILIFGLNVYSIKLPSIVIGLLLGFVLILLLNRWFKSNVALFASIITVLSAPFLYIAGSGTPLIMLVFWPTVLLWLGSKIQGKNQPKPIFSFLFAFALLLSIFTPHLIYLAIFIVLFAIVNPHLRFTVKNLPKISLITTGIIILGGVAILITGFIKNPTTSAEIFLSTDFSIGNYLKNISTAFLPFFAWNGGIESIFLSPLVGIAAAALAFVGLISTTKGFLASRNAIATCFIIFAIGLSGFQPDSAILLILPLAILIAHGLRYMLKKWYDLFPENPYARIFAILPISLFLGVVIISDLTHFAFGYRYTPIVANQFNNDLSLIYQNLQPNDTLVVGSELEYNFYSIITEKYSIRVLNAIPTNYEQQLATIGKIENTTAPGNLYRIITSSKSDNSDRIYLYKQ